MFYNLWILCTSGVIFSVLSLFGAVAAAGFPQTHRTSCSPLPESNKTYYTQEDLITDLTDPCRYDKITKPQNASPVFVQIDLNHLESAQQTQLTAYMTLQYRYNDARLAYKEIDKSRKTLYGETFVRERIWIPHLVVSNGKDSKRLGIEKSDVFVTVSPDGDVVLTQRVSTSFYCWMDLTKFPFDSQKCSLTWRSWTLNTTHLLLFWSEDVPVKVSENMHLTEFAFDDTKTFHRLVEASFSNGPLTGNFSELVFEFNLHREIGYYVLCYFLPSVLLVVTSWVTFWLQANDGPPRACLGASTVVSFITLNGGLVKDLPKISYVKASDVWFLAISIFIFGALAEFAFVNVIWRRKKRVELVKADSKYILTGAFVPSRARELARKSCENGVDEKSQSFTALDPHGQPPRYDDVQRGEEEEVVHENWQTMTPQEVAIWVDRKARIVFPVIFVVFNVFYWSFVYLA